MSRHAAKTAEHLIHVADHYYSVRDKQPHAAKQLHHEMLKAASQVDGVADNYAADGD